MLIAQRPAGTHLAGGWEFPGGKLEPGEERRAGLARELHEELGVRIGAPRPLMRVRHAYPTREILLDMWVVKSYSGEPQGLDGQALRWCPQDELASANLLPADKPIVRALRLPDRLTQTETPDYILGGSAGAAADRLRGLICMSSDQAMAASAAGADFVALQTPLPERELASLSAAVPIPIFARGIGLDQAWSLGVSGVNETPAALQDDG